MDVGFHDHGVEGLVDPAPALPDRELQVADSYGEGLVPVPVATCGASPGVFAPSGADPRGGLGLDQFLQQAFGDFADEFETVCRT